MAKASLYSTFGSKDELIRAYLNGRHHRRRGRIVARLAAYSDPRDRLLAVFDLQGEQFAEPGFHGCAFVNATAESAPGSAAEEATVEYRGWMRNLFAELAAATRERPTGRPRRPAHAALRRCEHRGPDRRQHLRRGLGPGGRRRSPGRRYRRPLTPGGHPACGIAGSVFRQ